MPVVTLAVTVLFPLGKTPHCALRSVGSESDGLGWVRNVGSENVGSGVELEMFGLEMLD
jgi:hypothetical protein